MNTKTIKNDHPLALFAVCILTVSLHVTFPHQCCLSKAIEMKDQAKILTLTEFVEQYGDTNIAMWFACNDSKTIDMAGTDALPNYDYQGHVSTK